MIDLEGLAEGLIVDSLSSGPGISGDPVARAVAAFGRNPRFPGVNTLMIFDGTCSGGCTGGDDDLERPELGNILIISEDLDSSDPDDADVQNSFFEFDFSGWGSGTIFLDSISVLDVEDEEGGAFLEAYQGGPSGTLLGTVPIPSVGDLGFADVNVGIAGVDFFRVTLNGSGAIDNIRVVSQAQVTATPSDSPTPTGEEPTPTPGGPTATSTSTPVSGDPTATPSELLPVTGLSSPAQSQTWPSVPLLKNASLKRLDGKAAFPANVEPDLTTAQAAPEMLMIPSLGIHAYIVPAGVELRNLNGVTIRQSVAPRAYAAGWDPSSAPLAAGGNTVLVGHHNAFSQIFRQLEVLQIGDEIQVVSAGGELYSYRVMRTLILEEAGLPLEARLENSIWIQPTTDEMLTVTCWPWESNTHRLIVLARPVEAEAR